MVGMSGGADSSAAAGQMLRRGFSVTGVTLRFFSAMAAEARKRDDQAVRRASAVCRRLGIDHMVIDAGSDFTRRVVDYFVTSYRNGKTPNPCVVCNQLVKFPYLAEAADDLGARFLVTGHYAGIVESGGRPFLTSGIDRKKDQSYFLYRVPVKYLSRTIFPLEGLRKAEILRRFASDYSRQGAAPESQDVCFIPGGDLKGFLKNRLRPRPGEIVDTEGRKLGEHPGICFYTMGQRRGLGVSAACPLYVNSLDSARDRIVLGKDEDLYFSSAACSSLRLRTRRLPGGLKARIRFRHRPAAVKRVEVGRGEMKVVFENPQRAVTPGQSLVLYSGGTVMGGGIIERGERA